MGEGEQFLDSDAPTWDEFKATPPTIIGKVKKVVTDIVTPEPVMSEGEQFLDSDAETWEDFKAPSIGQRIKTGVSEFFDKPATGAEQVLAVPGTEGVTPQEADVMFSLPQEEVDPATQPEIIRPLKEGTKQIGRSFMEGRKAGTERAERVMSELYDDPVKLEQAKKAFPELFEDKGGIIPPLPETKVEREAQKLPEEELFYNKALKSDLLKRDEQYIKDRKKKGAITRYFEDIVQMAPQFGAQAVVTMAGTPVAGGVFMFDQIAGSKYAELRQQGVEPERAYKASIASAAGQAPLEAIGIGKVFKAWKVGKPLTAKLKSMATAGATEFVTEWMQKYPDLAADVWAKTPGKTTSDRAKAFAKRFWQATKEGLYEGSVAFWMGGAGRAGKISYDEGTQTAREIDAAIDTDKMAEDVQKNIENIVEKTENEILKEKTDAKTIQEMDRATEEKPPIPEEIAPVEAEKAPLEAEPTPTISEAEKVAEKPVIEPDKPIAEGLTRVVVQEGSEPKYVTPKEAGRIKEVFPKALIEGEVEAVKPTETGETKQYEVITQAGAVPKTMDLDTQRIETIKNVYSEAQITEKKVDKEPIKPIIGKAKAPEFTGKKDITAEPIDILPEKTTAEVKKIEASKPDLVYKTKVKIKETGEEVTIEQDANEALKDTEDRIHNLRVLKDCIG
jgi:hypothetical protein